VLRVVFATVVFEEWATMMVRLPRSAKRCRRRLYSIIIIITIIASRAVVARRAVPDLFKQLLSFKVFHTLGYSQF